MKKTTPKNQAIEDMRSSGISTYFLLRKKEVLSQPVLTYRLGRLC